MSWDCNLHCLAVLTGRVPTCTSTLLRFPAPGCSSRYPKGGFCPFLILPLPLGMPPLPSPLFGAAWLCRGPWLRSQQGERRDLVAAPRSAPRGRSGSGEAPCAHLVRFEGREGKIPRCFERSRIPGALGCPLGQGCSSQSWSRCWSSALAVGPGRQGGRERGAARGSRRWVCVRQGGSAGEGWRRLLGDQGHPGPTWDHHSFAPLPRRPSTGVGSVSFPGRPPGPLLTGI